MPEPTAQCCALGLRVQAEVFTAAWLLLTPLIPAAWNLYSFLHPISSLPFRAHSPGIPPPLSPFSAFLCWSSVSPGCDLCPPANPKAEGASLAPRGCVIHMCRVYRARVDRMMLEWLAPAAANQQPNVLVHHLVYPPTPR